MHFVQLGVSALFILNKFFLRFAPSSLRRVRAVSIALLWCLTHGQSFMFSLIVPSAQLSFVLFQWFCHCSWSASFVQHISSFSSNGYSSSFSKVCPWFASSSTRLFPGILQCPGIHWIMISHPFVLSSLIFCWIVVTLYS